MSTEPLVTVGVPTYNRPEGLKKALDSLLKQSYQNIEIIISDNCSTDPSVTSVIDSYLKKSNNIRAIRQDENLGAANNFLFLEREATSDYFMLLADDDYILSSDLIEKLVFNIKDNILCFSDFVLSNEKDNKDFYNSYIECLSGDDYLKAWINNGSGFPFYGLYNKKLLMECGIPFEIDKTIAYYNEGLFLHKVFLTKKVGFIGDVKMYYNQNSQKPSKEVLVDNFLKYTDDVLDLYERQLIKNKDEVLSLINCKHYSHLVGTIINLPIITQFKVVFNLIAKRKCLRTIFLGRLLADLLARNTKRNVSSLRSYLIMAFYKLLKFIKSIFF